MPRQPFAWAVAAQRSITKTPMTLGLFLIVLVQILLFKWVLAMSLKHGIKIPAPTKIGVSFVIRDSCLIDRMTG
jgi:uncharacterized membrane protein (DUF373 family)